MEEEQRIGSILLVDCGAVMTKATLLEQVAGQYRLVARGEAPTTVESPWSDIAAGIRHAVEHISTSTGRHFFEPSGDLIIPELRGQRQQGVDAFAATMSASQPLQVVLAGLVRDLSVASAERAAAGTYSTIKAILASDAENGIQGEGANVHTMYDAAPDVICVAGGVEGGAAEPVLRLMEAATLASSLIQQSARPKLLFAGNSHLRRRVVQMVGKRAELSVADNVRPTRADENLLSARSELDRLYVQEKLERLPGLETVSKWSAVAPKPTARAFGRLIHYLGRLGDGTKGVLGVDVGAASTTIAAAFDGRLFTTIRGDLGVTFGAERMIQEHGAETVIRWLPEPMSGDEACGVLINKEIHPTSIPQDMRELWLDQALAREAIRTTLALAQPGWEPGTAQPYPHLLPLCDTIIVGGNVLARAPRPGQAALTVLDALEPIGVSTLVLDAHGLASALGTVAEIKPLAAVEVLDSGAFVNLATVVAPVGRARRGETILRVHVMYGEGKFSVEIRYGDLEVLPLPPGRQAVLELRPLHNFDVGLGGPGKAGKLRVNGGLAGLIIDARGRPLHIPGNTEQRQSQMQEWLWDVGG